MGETSPESNEPALVRAIGPWQATALNVTMIVGAGVFVTIPLMLKELPGPYAIWGWLAAGVLILVDGMIWSELGAMMPSSGGSYHFLLECYGKEKWGRLIAFLFIWQFLLSGPLELGSGLVATAQFSTALSPQFAAFNEQYTYSLTLLENPQVMASISPARLIGFGVGLFVIVLLSRNVATLGKLTITFWLGVMAVIAWVLIEGAIRFDPAVAFDYLDAPFPRYFGWKLGPAMVLAMYSYLGYYNVCYVGDEVREPSRTIPRAILFSALIVCLLFTGLHLAMLGVMPWHEVPTDDKALESFSLPAAFMGRIHGAWAVTAVTAMLIWCCFGSVFAGLLGYSRIPYGAARQGHFFRLFGHVHPTERIPHVSLWLVGGMMLFWSFFDLSTVINALIVTRILEQFVAQILGVMWLRKHQPARPRPFRIWLYPMPCLLALVGWLYLYVSAGWLYVALGAGTLAIGAVVFLIWSRHVGGWPFNGELPRSKSNEL